MPYAISALRNANLGWIFYKKYFDGYNRKKDSNKDQNNRNRDTLSNRNQTILEKQYENSSSIFDVNAPQNFSLQTAYPGLLIGSGYTHEYGNGTDKDDAFKVGFYVDYVSGIPCIPGHSVKGSIRAYFPNHKNEKYEQEKAELIVSILGGQDECKKRYDEFSLNVANAPEYTAVIFSTLLGELMFEGHVPIFYKNGKFEYEQLPLSQKDVFFDAYINRGGRDGFFLANDYITHHESPLKNPNPLQFLKVLPGVSFKFQFRLTNNLISTDRKKSLFIALITEFGLGAKTNVGYGQFK